MRNKVIQGVVLLGCAVLFLGCDSLRFAPGQEQKENAWLHGRVTELAAMQAATENASEQLQGLTSLAAEQSRAFVADYGMPQTIPAADSVEAILAGNAKETAETATRQSLERPSLWDAADGVMELGMGLAGLFGGVYGVRAVRFLRKAREQSGALREIVAGNELVKQTCPEQADAFKAAQQGPSEQSRVLVGEVCVKSCCSVSKNTDQSVKSPADGADRSGGGRV